jgi:hypothetical protein
MQFSQILQILLLVARKKKFSGNYEITSSRDLVGQQTFVGRLRQGSSYGFRKLAASLHRFVRSRERALFVDNIMYLVRVLGRVKIDTCYPTELVSFAKA